MNYKPAGIISWYFQILLLLPIKYLILHTYVRGVVLCIGVTNTDYYINYGVIYSLKFRDMFLSFSQCYFALPLSTMSLIYKIFL